jgi:tetratricopeptide (TPR) repeat protein
VELDENLAAGHAVLSLIRLLNHWDWRGADAESQRAVEIAPGDAYVHWKRGVYLQYAGRGEEAIEAHRRAESLDPLSLLAIEEAGWPLYYARRFDEAGEQFRKSIELAPEWDQGHWSLGMTLVHQERYDEAVSSLRTAAKISPGNSLLGASLVYGIGRSGRVHEAETAFQSLTANHPYIPGWFISIACIGMHKKDQALEFLEDAFTNREPCLVTLKVDPVFDPLRGESRFSHMIRRTGLDP